MTLLSLIELESSFSMDRVSCRAVTARVALLGTRHEVLSHPVIHGESESSARAANECSVTLSFVNPNRGKQWPNQ